MKTLFDKETEEQILDRINKLTPESKGLWGKMDVAQMLAHCNEVMAVANGESKLKRPLFGRIVGPIARPMLYNEKPFPRNSPTMPDFKMVDPKEFKKEKERLISLIQRFQAHGETGLPVHKHPFFGSMKNDQWGTASFKHLNHHLEQFSV